MMSTSKILCPWCKKRPRVKPYEIDSQHKTRYLVCEKCFNDLKYGREGVRDTSIHVPESKLFLFNPEKEHMVKEVRRIQNDVRKE